MTKYKELCVVCLCRGEYEYFEHPMLRSNAILTTQCIAFLTSHVLKHSGWNAAIRLVESISQRTRTRKSLGIFSWNCRVHIAEILSRKLQWKNETNYFMQIRFLSQCFRDKNIMLCYVIARELFDWPRSQLCAEGEEYYLLRYNAKFFVETGPTFQKTMSPPPSFFGPWEWTVPLKRSSIFCWLRRGIYAKI
jgi:hypothetical protein